MVNWILKKIVGSKNQREIRRLRKVVAQINEIEAQLQSLSVTLLVGPEGGLSEQEVESARLHGFRSVSLGPRILRVETAALVAVALTQSALGGLD